MRKSMLSLLEKKGKNEKITMLTAYDYLSAKAVDEAGIDVILVGDSLAMVVLGLEDTLSVSLDEMLVFTKAVSRASKNALVLSDMPFGSYEGCEYEALKNATRFIKEGRANAVKLEGGEEICKSIEMISKAKIPVVAHLGLTPQAINALGGYKVQGKNYEAAQKLLKDSRAVESAGASMLVLECVPTKLALKITQELKIPTIGIGAGKYCDGQVLVYHDLLGINEDFKPKFVKRYANFNPKEAVKEYIKEVKEGIFPSADFSFDLDDEWLDKLY